jgi:hypothetical protein
MSQATAAAPAISVPELIARLGQDCFGPRAVRLLGRDEVLPTLRYRCHQIYYVHHFATSILNIPISINALARGFECQQHRVTSAIAHGLEPPEARGRHPGMVADREAEILVWIADRAARGNPTTRSEVREHVSREYEVPVTRGWVNSFICRHAEALCKVKSSPQEADRLEIPRCFLDETLSCLATVVQGRPTELVFNLDEVGISDWEDRKTKSVLVPRSMADQAVHHKVSRKLKHVSVIACVSAAGESLMPYIVTSQDSTRIREQLKKSGVRFGTDFILKQRSKPYINAEIFMEYIRLVFLPNLNELRSLDQFADEDAVLLMDNCPSHVKEDVLDLLRDARVRVITWAPHATHIFQELDVSLFGVLKRREQYALPFEDDQTTAGFLLRIYRTFKQTMIEPNIWGAFHECGLEFDTSVEPYRLRLNEEKLRNSEGFREIWSLDFPPEKLSARRRNARFGWINKPE